MELGEAQKNSPEAPESLENDLKIKNLEFLGMLAFSMNAIVFSRSEGQLGAQICFQEARKLREKKIKGATRKLREKKSSKMR